jgi:nucleotide-binding universal stress UspA family protein
MKVVKGTAAPLRQIILAIDGSNESANALAFVLSKFQPHRLIDKGRRVTVRVSVVHVMAHRRLAPLTIRMTVPWIKSEKRVKEAARRLVEQSAQELIEAGFAAEPVCKLGDPAQEIIKVASSRHADLIVMGAKGLGTIDRILLGSVSTRVMHYANCPVLVVR